MIILWILVHSGNLRAMWKGLWQIYYSHVVPLSQVAKILCVSCFSHWEALQFHSFCTEASELLINAELVISSSLAYQRSPVIVAYACQCHMWSVNSIILPLYHSISVLKEKGSSPRHTTSWKLGSGRSAASNSVFLWSLLCSTALV